MTSLRPKAYSYIRMSTEVQLRGDSKRRQEEASRRYAEAHNLELVEGPELHDIGVSAFKGANVKAEGALGRFLQAVEDGKIEHGSYLLVESLDRLSRQEIIDSMSLFFKILRGNIKLVTLTDGQVYEDGADFQQVLFSLVIMSRAYEESKMKSERVSAAWERKRQQADSKILTKRTLGWLKVNKKGTGFEPVQEKTAIVQQIFDLCIAGMGNYAIARYLTDQGIAPFGKSKSWNPASIGKILTSRAVLGDYQPHKLVDGKSTPVGDSVQGYYPQIVDEETFNQCQTIRTSRRNKGGGRKGNNVANLFSGLAKCGYCEGKLFRLNNGVHAYLVCENVTRTGSCKAKAWRYHDFETSFLSFISELDLSSLEGGKIGKSRQQKLTEERQALQGKLDHLKANREKTFALYLQDQSIDYVKDKLMQFEIDIAEIQQQMADIEQKLTQDHHLASPEQLQQHLKQLQISEPNFALRAHAAHLIKDQIKGLFLYSEGSLPMTEKAIAELGDKIDDETITHMRETSTTDKHYGVVFNHGSSSLRLVYPDKKDPTKVKETVTNTEMIARIEKRTRQS